MTEAPRLTVVLPTYNEAANIPKMVERITAALAVVPHEIIVVDDSSPDGTAATARAIAARQLSVRCIKRVGRHGLSSACVEGMMAASAPVVAIMDADGQHDEAILPRMLEAIDRGSDMAIATRYAQDGAVADGFSKTRAWGSRIATAMSRHMLGRDVSDPMSGYFMLRRDLADRIAPEVSRDGFKILFDILSRVGTTISVTEIPFSFRPRDHGESKLGALVAVQFVGLLLSRLSGGILPIQFVLFSLVGALGLVVHLTTLYVLNVANNVPFVTSQITATLVAMTTNFLLNNVFTYSAQRLKGWRLLAGLIGFYAVCSIGALANVGVAAWLFAYSAQPLLAGFAGAVMSAVFNYAVSKTAIWRDG